MDSLIPEICSYTENIWKSVLDLTVQRKEVPFSPVGKENTLAGCVHIMGAWEGTISLQCPKPLARKVAAIMFSVSEEEADMEQITDALGELANMTGGNIKALFPEPCKLSLPTVAVTDFDLHFPGTQLETKVNFECLGHHFAVSIHKKVNNK